MYSRSKARLLLANVFTALITAMGLVSIANAAWHWTWINPTSTYIYLLIGIVSAGFQLRVPNQTGSLSMNFMLILIGAMELSTGETMLVACAGVAAQGFLINNRGESFRLRLFHVSATALAVLVCHEAYKSPWLVQRGASDWIRLLVAGLAVYAMNSFPKAIVEALSRNQSLESVWKEANWGLSYYLAGSSLAGTYHHGSSLLGAENPVLLIPVALAFYCSYHSYVGRVFTQRAYTESMTSLHQRTIEALALAIEAKDMTAHNHLRRLQLYCVEIGAQMGLKGDDLEAIRAAAILHDIGKLAVPEHILSKPGKLTREEFEKIKIHPLVGAEILDRVNFPYPVSGLVLAHHEKWNGGGYPHGLKGEAIPLGARILAVADCLDALVSDRPYRVAVSMEEAISRICAESGVSFDPKVVEIVKERYQELESGLASQSGEPALPSRQLAQLGQSLSIAGLGPHYLEPAGEFHKPGFLDTIAAARQEAQVQLELTQLLGRSLKLDETLPGFASGLKRILHFDALVVYVLKDGGMIPRFATGECTSVLLSRVIPIGHGLSGWVAQHGKPILNGNPSLELGAAAGEKHGGVLTAALTVPLAGMQGTAGVLMACRKGAGNFTKDNLRFMLGVSSKLGLVIENSLKYEQASTSAKTDFLTGLPNARALQLQLDVELARVRRMGGSLSVLVTDLDGFKQVNDRFGHAAGNSVLCEIGKALRLACREYDFVARMGGDEFVLLLPGLDEDPQQKIAQFSRAAADAARAVCPASQVGLSVGLARYPLDAADAEQLLAIADQRMYQAKQVLKLKKHRGIPRGYDFDWAESTSSR